MKINMSQKDCKHFDKSQKHLEYMYQCNISMCLYFYETQDVYISWDSIPIQDVL